MKHISDILREEREKQGYSIDDVVSETKIRKNFVIDIEHGRYNQLPSEVYALGFVKNYASFLGISEDRAAALFRREFDSKQHEPLPKFRKAVHVSRGFSLQRGRNLLLLGVSVVVLLFIAFQFSFLVVGPKLEIENPQENQIIEDNVVMVTGKTDPQASVFVNNENVYVDLSGSFRKNLYMESGDKTVSVVAKNRFGRETRRNILLKVE